MHLNPCVLRPLNTRRGLLCLLISQRQRFVKFVNEDCECDRKGDNDEDTDAQEDRDPEDDALPFGVRYMMGMVGVGIDWAGRVRHYLRM